MRFAARLFAILVVALWLGACGKSISSDQLEAPSRESVRPTDEIPQVIKVVGPRLCTGTLVAADKVLTASHCMRETHPRVVLATGHVVRAVSFNVLGTGERNDSSDVAVMHFDVSLAEEIGVTPLGLSGPVGPGTPVSMIGYGCNQRAMGTNKIFRFRDYMEVMWSRSGPGPQTGMSITGPSNRAETCAGDSGGPALVTQNGKMLVAGVLHGLLAEPGKFPLSVYSYVTEGPNRQFVDKELGRPSSGQARR